ncbi:LysR family transcriptional regulator ArgP [Dongia deserti]|uniref:LysR family transcriptional regulator ArgP n=1 Tax=Dongia deserti TaxID=2268030 RepID=UPI000E651ECB|nr:LysR family transcriptional regulator ArgP [Dongia deserti]
MLDYGSLAAVAAVVREGSFDRAAIALGVTASAISQRVRALEERLGSVLIVRGQPCTATAAGARICAHVERVRLLEGEMVADLPALFGEADAKAPPTVRIAVNRDSLGTWFVPALAAFTARTGALVDLVLDREEFTTDRLRSGEVLAAVTDNASAVQGCRKLSLGSLRYVATASPAFARTWFPHGVDKKSLAQAPVLIFDRRDHLQAKWALEIKGVRLDGPCHWIPATRAFLDATLAGLGWGMNPLCLVKDILADERLVDLSPGKHVDVALYWQYARVGARLLDALTQGVVAAAKRGLIARGRRVGS